MSTKRTTTLDILARKGGKPIVVLTCYTAPMAKLLDGNVDMMLVGDSLGMVVYGMSSTLPVTLDMMIAHGKAVATHSHKSLVIVDMPFGSYQASLSQAFESAARVLAETGCAAVKLEGGKEMAETVAYLVSRGIPVVGHVGLMPQRVHAMGGYRFQGRNEQEVAHITEDALAIQQAGAFAIVLEGVREDVARSITAELTIPTIGIGASPACDGQVLVLDDMLGLTADYVPSFVKHYAQLSQLIPQAVKTYAEEVQNRTFPGPEHCFKGKKTS